MLSRFLFSAGFQALMAVAKPHILHGVNEVEVWAEAKLGTAQDPADRRLYTYFANTAKSLRLYLK